MNKNRFIFYSYKIFMQTQLEYSVTTCTIILVRNHSSHLTFNIQAWFQKTLCGQKWPHARRRVKLRYYTQFRTSKY